MPIISTISIPLLYSHYLAVEKVREVHPPFSELPKEMFLLLLVPGNPFLVFLVGLVTIGIQVLFLEAYWQTYRTSRIRSYAAGALALLVTGMLVTFAITPARDLVIYLAGS